MLLTYEITNELGKCINFQCSAKVFHSLQNYLSHKKSLQCWRATGWLLWQSWGRRWWWSTARRVCQRTSCSCACDTQITWMMTRKCAACCRAQLTESRKQWRWRRNVLLYVAVLTLECNITFSVHYRLRLCQKIPSVVNFCQSYCQNKRVNFWWLTAYKSVRFAVSCIVSRSPYLVTLVAVFFYLGSSSYLSIFFSQLWLPLMPPSSDVIAMCGMVNCRINWPCFFNHCHRGDWIRKMLICFLFKRFILNFTFYTFSDFLVNIR